MTDKLKLLPREATREMLEAMDECSMEGYDERLYAGHAGSVYMAAWDAFHGQHCYCGDITNLGVIHRDDGPCHYPDHKEPEQDKERCVGCEACIDTACGRDECPKGWPKAAQPEQEPHGYLYKTGKFYHEVEGCNPKTDKRYLPLYTTPPQRTEQEQQIETLKRCLFQMQEAAKDLVEQAKSLPTPQRKPLTDEEIGAILEGVNAYGTRLYTFARAIEAAHGIKGDA